MVMFRDMSYSVDDTRFMPGDSRRAGGLTVYADVVLRDGAPCADEPTEIGTVGGGEPKPEDVRFALLEIEQQAFERLRELVDDEG